MLDIRLIPVVFRAAYTQPITGRLGLAADFGAGFVFSRVLHYENAIAMLTGNLSDSRERTPIAGGRLFAVYTLPLNLRLFAGGGLDVLFEDDGPIPMPLVEAGLMLNPLRARRPRPQPAPAVAVLPPEPLPEPPMQLPPVEIVVARELTAVFFPPDSAVMFEQYRPVLQEAARRLQENPALHLTLRGYTAPFSTPGARTSLSAARAQSVMRYLVDEHGISADRITLEFFGSDRMPEGADNTMESLRSVELVLE